MIIVSKGRNEYEEAVGIARRREIELEKELTSEREKCRELRSELNKKTREMQ